MLSHVLSAVDKTSCSFSAHGKIGNFIIIIIIIKIYAFSQRTETDYVRRNLSKPIDLYDVLALNETMYGGGGSGRGCVVRVL